MDKIIENLYGVLNYIDTTETHNKIEKIIDQLEEFKENLLGSLNSIDPNNGIDDVIEDIELLIDKVNDDMPW